MTEEIEKQLQYAIEHDPVRYAVKRKWFFWQVVNLKFDKPVGFFMTRPQAGIHCDLLNSIYQSGYTMGQDSIIKILFKKD